MVPVLIGDYARYAGWISACWRCDFITVAKSAERDIAYADLLHAADEFRKCFVETDFGDGVTSLYGLVLKRLDDGRKRHRPMISKVTAKTTSRSVFASSPAADEAGPQINTKPIRRTRNGAQGYPDRPLHGAL
jgi:hypothetical protein